MYRNHAGIIYLAASLTLFLPSISHAGGAPGGTNIETRPFETDDHITNAVRKIFAADEMLAKQDIQIETKHAIVTLTGKVKSSDDYSRAYLLAKRLPEVDKVRNHLKIDGD